MWQWFKVFNVDEFNKWDVPDIYLKLNLRGLGEQEIVVARGFKTSILFLGYWLVPGLNNRNGFSVRDKVSAYIDDENTLWVGYNENNM